MMTRIVFAILLFAVAAEAQDKPKPELRVTGGGGGFIDEDWIDHGAIGGAAPPFPPRRGGGGAGGLFIIWAGEGTGHAPTPPISFFFCPRQTRRAFVVWWGGVLPC